jgi:predicted MPP superfamily phosphohydrolase
VTLLLAVVVGGHFYLAQRLILELDLSPQLQRALVVTLCALAATLFLQPFGERLLPHRMARWLAWPASLWMGLGFLLLLSVAATDLFWWLAGTPARAASAAVPDDPALARMRAVGVLALGGVAAVVGLRGALRPPGVKRVELALERWPAGLAGFRIVQISDIHIGPILDRRFAAELVERVNALTPDLIAVTGDLVDGSVTRLRDEVAPFAGLRARHGVFFVTGNHDYFSGADPWAEHVAGLGLRVLRNERVPIRAGEDVFDLAGVEDHRANLVPGGLVEDLPAALEGRDPERAVVLLAHDPGTFREASRRDVDLQISGHTHGGQIWPFVYFVRLAVPWVAGHYRRGRSQLWVSRGTGFWGPPMRIGAPAEITELVLRPAA